jgi:hypothetical protein
MSQGEEYEVNQVFEGCILSLGSTISFSKGCLLGMAWGIKWMYTTCFSLQTPLLVFHPKFRRISPLVTFRIASLSCYSYELLLLQACSYFSVLEVVLFYSSLVRGRRLDTLGFFYILKCPMSSLTMALTSFRASL